MGQEVHVDRPSTKTEVVPANAIQRPTPPKLGKDSKFHPKKKG